MSTTDATLASGSTPTPTPTATRDLATAGAITAAVAAAAAAVTYGIVAALGTDLVVPSSPGSEELTALPLVVVLVATVVPVLVGTGVHGLLERRTANPVRTWRALALGVGVLSLGGVLGIDAGTDNVVGLAALHLVVAAVAAFVLPLAVERVAGRAAPSGA